MTQVLADDANIYLYGNGRISQSQITNPQLPEYFISDALGSVRQLADPAGAVTLTQSYAPYGETVSNVGSGYSAYQFTGEARDVNGLTFLRARYYAPNDGRFINRDTWAGDYNRPLSLNRWGYVEGNPVNFVDPHGRCKGEKTDQNNPDIECWEKISEIEGYVSNITISPENWTLEELNSVQKAIEGMVHSVKGTDNFSSIFTDFTLYRAGWFGDWITGNTQGATAAGLGKVTFYDDAFTHSYNIGSAVVIHEFGHILDARYGVVENWYKDAFWNDCELKDNGRCKTFGHDPECLGTPASFYAYRSPEEDFSDMFAYYVWEDNSWSTSVLFSHFMPPDEERREFMRNLIETITNELSN